MLHLFYLATIAIVVVLVLWLVSLKKSLKKNKKQTDKVIDEYIELLDEQQKNTENNKIIVSSINDQLDKLFMSIQVKNLYISKLEKFVDKETIKTIKKQLDKSFSAQNRALNMQRNTDGTFKNK